jgi:hypothetical protein
MLANFESIGESEKQNKYPISEDSAFTPDEIEIIEDFKASYKKKIQKNYSILKGLEVGFWGISSYSLARFLILTSGSQGLTLAIATTFFINQITNRECLDAFKLNRKDSEWEAQGMNSLIKFGLSTIVSGIVLWSAVGDFIQMLNQSKSTYNTLQTALVQFNKLPEEEQNKMLAFMGIAFAAGLYTASTRRR